MTETMDAQKLESVLTLAEGYVIRPTFDSSDVGSAICVLEDALHTALNNAPIWFADGNVKQWALCMNNAVQFREALYWLKNREVSFDSASAMKSVDANIKRGRNAMNKAIAEKTTVHRAMYRNDIGWIDFVWGDIGTIKPNGQTKKAKGLSHIIEARIRKDGLTYQQVCDMLVVDVTDTIANGVEDDRTSTETFIRLRLKYKRYYVQLFKNKGSNTWIVTAFDDNSVVEQGVGFDTSLPTVNEPTLTRPNEVSTEYTINLPQNNDEVKIFDSTDLSQLERVKLLGEATALINEKSTTTDPLRKIQIAKRLREIIEIVFGVEMQSRKPQRTEQQQLALQNPNSQIDVTNAVLEMLDSADSKEDKQCVYMLEQRLLGDFRVDENYKGYNADSALQEFTSKSLVNEANVQTKEELDIFVTNVNRRRTVLHRAESEYSLLKVGAVESEMDTQEVQIKRIAESVLSGDDYLEYARLSDNSALFRNQYIKADEKGENAREIQVEYMGETIKLGLAIQILGAQKDKLYYKLKDEYVKKVKQSPMYLELKSEIEQMEREHYSAATSAIDTLNNANGVTVEQANDWVKSNTTVSKQAKSRLSKQGYTQEALEKDMADFYRLTGGKIGKVSIETNGARRAHTTGVMTEATAVINIDGNFSKKTLWHEMGHHLEKDPKASALAYSFIKKRRESDKMYRLNDLVKSQNPNRIGGYRSNEYAFKDSWIHPYVGKFYSKGTTEVFAMAMGWLSSPKECQKLISQDKELFDMVTGYLQTQRDDVCMFGLEVLKAREDLKKAESVSLESKLKELASKVSYKDLIGFDMGVIELAKYEVKRRSKGGSKIEYLGVIESVGGYWLVSHATIQDYMTSRKYIKKYITTWVDAGGAIGGNKYFDTEDALKAWAQQKMEEKNANN